MVRRNVALDAQKPGIQAHVSFNRFLMVWHGRSNTLTTYEQESKVHRFLISYCYDIAGESVALPP